MKIFLDARHHSSSPANIERRFFGIPLIYAAAFDFKHAIQRALLTTYILCLSAAPDTWCPLQSLRWRTDIDIDSCTVCPELFLQSYSFLGCQPLNMCPGKCTGCLWCLNPFQQQSRAFLFHCASLRQMISTQIRHLTAALRTLRYYILLSGGRVMASVIVGFAGNKSRNSADIHHRPITMLSSDPR